MCLLSQIHNEIAVPAESFVQFGSSGCPPKDGIIKENTFYIWKHRGKIIAERSCKGKKAMVLYSTIPEPQRKAVWEYLFHQDRESLMKLPDVPEGWLRQIFHDFDDKKSSMQDQSRKELEHLSDKELEIAKARYNFVTAAKNYVGNVKYKETGKKRIEFVSRYNNQMMLELTSVYETLGEVNIKSLYRWAQLLNEEGSGTNIEVLAPSYRLSAKNRELTPLPVSHQNILKSKWLLPTQPTISAVHRLYEKEMRAMGEEPASAFKARRFLQQWAKLNSPEAIYLRKGEKEMKDKVLPYIERDNELLNFMDVIVSDGHTLNFQIINPKTGRLCRATLICWVDMRSLMILGFEIMLTENTMSVVSSLRQSMMMAGHIIHALDDSFPAGHAIVPKIIYTDNGKAFKNKYFKGGENLEHKFSGLFDRLAPFGLVKAVYALPYNAQSKVNERIFGTFLECEKRVPTYSGNSIDNKPARMKRNEKFHKESFEDALAKVGYLDLQSAYQLVKEWVIEYNQRPGSGKYLNGMSPFDKAKEAIEECKKSPIAYSDLNYMMQEERNVRLNRNGIKMNGIWYNSLALSSLERGDWDFKVRYDMMDLSKIYVYDDTGNFICEAERWAGQGIHPMAEYLGSSDHQDQYQKAIQQKGEYAANARYNAKKEFQQAQSYSNPIRSIEASTSIKEDRKIIPEVVEPEEYKETDLLLLESREEIEIDFTSHNVKNPII